MKKIKVSLVLIWITLVSCSNPTARPESAGPATSSFAVTPSVASVATNTFTNISVPSSTSPTQTPTFSPTPELFKTQCLEIAPLLPDQVVPEYSLVYSFLGDGQRYSYRFKTNQRLDFPDGVYPYATSYDGNWFLYVQYGKVVRLVAETYDQKVQWKYQMQDNWRPAPFWLSNQYFFINLVDNLLPPMLVIDPGTGKQSLLPSEYPDLVPFDGAGRSPFHFGGSSVVYDPSLELVVYLKTIEEGRRYRHFITLYNRKTKTELASLEDEPSYPLRRPIWSVDGEEVIVANHLQGVGEIYSIQQDGQVNQLTNFRSYYQDLKISGISLSPDKRMLAFWMKLPDMSVEEQLFLLDMETKQVTNLCVSSTKDHGSQPTWSPDSRYIAVGDHVETNRYHTILIDPIAKLAAQVNDNAYPVGWLKVP